ncbi:unnamed protein product [Heligmosomoides polygyrus]|uniref:Endo/exonuclease/phosphatase domain-containing protein n=1 Tax=Heligmosomoides polygyrus TaxID=6339 RepID=A0A183GMA6_HELPZ|nr:unnamed protein product [Heligmosomoides polygyrus]
MIVSKRFRDAIASIDHFDDRLMKIVVAVEQRRCHFFSAYAPLTGCSEQTKDELWSLLDEKTAEVPSEDMIAVAGDLNGHVGATKDGYSCRGGFGYGSRNADDERILEYADSRDFVNTKFRRRDSNLISFYSGNAKTQIDYVLVRRRDQGLVREAKTVPHETVATQHCLLMCTLEVCTAEGEVGRAIRSSKDRIDKQWRLSEKDATLTPRMRSSTVTTVDEMVERGYRRIIRAVKKL